MYSDICIVYIHRDICPILKDASAMKTVTDVISDHIRKNLGKIDAIVGKQI
jgi:hypothetical protein